MGRRANGCGGRILPNDGFNYFFLFLDSERNECLWVQLLSVLLFLLGTYNTHMIVVFNLQINHNLNLFGGHRVLSSNVHQYSND